MATVLEAPRADRAFERLYRRHVADVYRYVLAVLQNEADAEDATQTTFLSAYRAFERGQRPERPQNWLIAIAHNVCRQRFRESARRPRLVELEDDVAAREVDDGTPNAEDIRRALGFLAFNQRAALVMRELQGRSYGEIAGILGVSNGAVETLLFRARRAMREQLEGGLSCGDAELAVSKRVDGELAFRERGALRAHLRECSECAALERRLRFRGRALKKIALVPLPQSLGSLFGGGAAGTGAAVGAKAAAVVVAGVFGTGLAGDAIEQTKGAREHRTVAASAPRPVFSSGAGVASPEARVAAAPNASRFEPARVAQRSSASTPTRPSPHTGARAGASPSVTASARPRPEAGLGAESSLSPDAGTSASPPAAHDRPEKTSRDRPVRERPVGTPGHPVPKRGGDHPRAAELPKVRGLPKVRDLPKPPKPPKPVELPKRPELPGPPELPNLPEVSRAADAPKPELPKPPEVPKPEVPKLPSPPPLPKPPELPKPPQVPTPPELPKPPELPTLP